MSLLLKKEIKRISLWLMISDNKIERLKSKKEDKKLDMKIITMYIKTFDNNGKLILYLISWYNE